MKSQQSPVHARPASSLTWQLDMGAQLVPGAGVRFRVWAPNAQHVDVEIADEGGKAYHRLDDEDEHGVFAGTVPGLGAGALYRYRLDGGASYPDPYSRCQPEGVHGPSHVVSTDFPWQDEGWPGMRIEGAVIYELHVGTFTPEGAFDAAIGQLDELRALGITAIELMPIAEFPGKRNWGYDGVYLYAPSLTYGGIVGLKRLVDAAHRQGIAVILDVVYNHLGPSGNYLAAFAREYFTDRYGTPWGKALNYDGPGGRWVRHFGVQNACYWLNEYHIDGLRLDATHAIFDASPVHLLRELAATARASVPAGRSVVITAESDTNDVGLLAPAERGGCGLDAVWADDFHHALHTYLTRERDGYYADYSGNLADVGRAVEQSFLYQGEWSRALKTNRGTRVTDEPARQFVFSLQNHDQIGNRAFGGRLNHLVDPALFAVASAILLLAPETPLLFMGQEFAASSPFQFFTDHDPDLGRLVTEGRREEFRDFDLFRDPFQRENIPDPQAELTFLRSKLDFSERQSHAGIYALYRDLIALRRSDPVFARQDRERTRAFAVGETAFGVHRWSEEGERLLLANFGDETAARLSDVLGQAEGEDRMWSVLLTSADARYGRGNREVVVREEGEEHIVMMPARSAVVLGSP